VSEGVFRVRGVVEGFYGPPWSHDARLELIDFIAARDMNAYAYAPKDEAKHRARWREPYDVDEVQRFAALATRASDAHVRFGFAVSPGTDIAYASRDDRTALLDKLRALADVGVVWFLLLLDDIPMRSGLGAEHAALATALLDTLTLQRPSVAMTLCPTEYVGTQSSAYLSDLAAGLPAEVDVMWTGPTVCSPTITAADARARAAALGGRLPLIWDNYPVNDAGMTRALHLGPYQGRDPQLADAVTGVLCNPMIQPRASKVSVATAAAFLAAPHTYQRDDAWRAAIADAGGPHAQALGVLARACADSPLAGPEDLELARLVEAVRDAIDGPDWAVPVAEAATVLRATRDLPAAMAAEDGLATEIAPWAAAARREADAGLAALRVVQHIRPIAVIEDEHGRAAAPDAELAMQHVFAMLFGWTAARANDFVVFGPRFIVYTPVVQLAGGLPGLDAAQAVREDANAIDALCRVALDAYGAWCSEAGAPVEVLVDGDARACAADGSFDGRGTTAMVRAGRFSTRVDGRPPFRDRRIA
jgi:hyaluronoglucosaminidase